MNWESINREIKLIEWVTGYLELEDRQHLAVLIVERIDEAGSLTKSMREVMQAVMELAQEEEDEEGKEKEGDEDVE